MQTNSFIRQLINISKRGYTSEESFTQIAGRDQRLGHCDRTERGICFAAKEYEASSLEPVFLDLAQVPAAQRQAILEAAGLGFLTGGSDGRFRPNPR